ncbi:hypothetical protein [Emcibacter nanhaiensis]|uniref:Uncharacterized protein n=1 Tax=Emcibacter nanhaiensis TaxID=1505037 RepID=A0A501PAE8_9PROT|nr:hypothetical protein [Emcibacter nanhaiensis]TPD57323.1 hypothetical protein FIV46_14435 [Emcibacter nanhaiensis]
MADNTENNSDERLSMRQSVMIWVVGAVLGWVVAVASVYSALRSPESEIAENKAPLEEKISPEDAEKVQEIMPAAGQEDKKSEDEN